MGDKIARSLAEKGRHFVRAGNETHHLAMGPGPDLEAEWLAAGLTLPDLDRLRHYRSTGCDHSWSRWATTAPF